MTPEQFKALKTGDLVRGRFSGFAFVVTQNHGDRVTAVRTQDLANSDEWDLVDRDGQVVIDHAAEQPARGEAVALAELGLNAGRTYVRGFINPWEGPNARYTNPLYTAPPAPSVPDDVVKDAARFRWLLEDHADPETRVVVKTLLVIMRTRSLSGARLDIDAAMLAAAPGVKP